MEQNTFRKLKYKCRLGSLSAILFTKIRFSKQSGTAKEKICGFRSAIEYLTIHIKTADVFICICVHCLYVKFEFIYVVQLCF